MTYSASATFARLILPVLGHSDTFHEHSRSSGWAWCNPVSSRGPGRVVRVERIPSIFTSKDNLLLLDFNPAWKNEETSGWWV